MERRQRSDHRAIEVGLDWLAEATRAAKFDIDAVRALVDLAARHYAAEEPFLAALAIADPKIAAKLRAQHDEALEIGARLIESLEAGGVTDTAYLSRRFLAMAQHNIIEEERDVFPLMERIAENQIRPTTPAETCFRSR
ncbi:MAG: hemerythrin domain-containing protein [Bryobacterales bacterium]|nr:hemerythrin domain-containing protein [Bryobacterales bacterium]